MPNTPSPVPPSSPPPQHLHSPAASHHTIASSSSPSASNTVANTAADRLVGHLLAAKRSLSAINDVYRANELVTAARDALEESVIIGSRTVFVERGVREQKGVLRDVRVGIERLGRRSQRELDAKISELDEAGKTLMEALDALRSTRVEDAINPTTDARPSLLDFVDEDEVNKLHAKLEESIDRTQTARATFAVSLQDFDKDLDSIRPGQREKAPATTEGAIGGKGLGRKGEAQQEDKDRISPMPELFESLEAQATEMASLLESLVRHFDFCVTAVKHAQNTSASVSLDKITSSVPEGMDLHLSASGPLTPITEEERLSMLSVIDKDAGEVDDVVLDIRDRLNEMEGTYEQVLDYSRLLENKQKTAVDAFRQLEAVGARLPIYVAHSQEFLVNWSAAMADITEHYESLVAMSEFYAGFLTAYHGLVLEAGRRRTVENRMSAIMKEAIMKVEKLYQEDIEEREAFRAENGDFLPADIWPGLDELPLRFVVRKQVTTRERADDKSSVQES